MEPGNYRHLLLAVDFEQDNAPVIMRARQLRDLLGARLTLLHVVEHIPPAMESMYLGYAGEMALPAETAELEEELLKVAKQQLDELGADLGVPAADRLIKTGATGQTIDTMAAELDIDLVVIGTHGRHGILGLFGSTSRTVLRNSSCDVLSVKIPDTRG